MAQVSIYAARTMQGLGEEIEAKSGGKIKLGNVSWARFPDHTPNIKVQDVIDLAWNKHVVFLADFTDMDDFFSQISGTFAAHSSHHAGTKQPCV